MSGSQAARALLAETEVLDLHIDAFIPQRLFGWDPHRRHRDGLGFLFGQFDFPRATAGGLTGAMASITTNPLRGAAGRWATFQRNWARLRHWESQSNGAVAFVEDAAGYQRARAAGRTPLLLSIQGGDALEAAPQGALPPQLLRVTLVHLTSSFIGAPSSPGHRLRADKGLTSAGRDLVARLNIAKIFVDLAHIHPQGFWDVLDVHAPDLPPIVTHTGVNGVYPHWRNLDDAQIRAVAARGGVIGVIFHRFFLARWGIGAAQAVLDHLDHLIQVGGEGVAALGSDYDGMIWPPWALRGAGAYATLTQMMLARGWSTRRIHGILGGNALRALRALRPS
ncbi:membrane dipeptidase [Myxococcota bacterium]|nr:membrane dipeptidase [Myxococcota bacterium]MBU1429559.1 membrane dipeptidase [Myxococcota bacterium]MBU1900370.1 membrane dipeptidase [Myxococcota bacterium]